MLSINATIFSVSFHNIDMQAVAIISKSYGANKNNQSERYILFIIFCFRFTLVVDVRSQRCGRWGPRPLPQYYSVIHVRHLKWLIKTAALTYIFAEAPKEGFTVVNKQNKKTPLLSSKEPLVSSALCSDAAFCWSRTAPPARAEMARKPRGHGTAFSWRWVSPLSVL